MASERMVQQINEQINKEMYSAYIYLSMENYFANLNLDGFANWMRVQFREEMDHAFKFIGYLYKIGAEVRLAPIAKPDLAFASAYAAFAAGLAHEKTVTASIHALLDTALEEKDRATASFLQWYVDEQAEEEESFGKIAAKLKLIGDNSMGLLMLDQELAARVYTPVPGGIDPAAAAGA